MSDECVSMALYGDPRGRTTLMPEDPALIDLLNQAFADAMPTPEEAEAMADEWLARDDVRDALADLRLEADRAG